MRLDVRWLEGWHEMVGVAEWHEGWRQRVVCFAVEPLVNLYGTSIEPRLKNFY